MSNEARPIAAPVPNVETQPYWDAADKGELLLKTCTSCGEHHHYPRALCPFCFSDKTEWTKAQGTGTIYSFSVMKRAKIPYTLAYVTLDEGVTMLTNIVDTDFDKIEIGQKVKVVFKPSEGGPQVPMFTPV
jgi:uncharacterized OB-fold protein